MKLGTIYKKAVQAGCEADPRGEKAVREQLRLERERFEKLPKGKKKDYDQERLTNPYADTRILNGSPEKEVKTVMVGIDIEVGELLLVDLLNKRGKKIDLAIAHHPEGKALANFYDVMRMHTDIFAGVGVPVTIAEQLSEERRQEVARSVSAVNHFRSTDAARLLGLPLMCLHTAADNHVASYLQKRCDKEKPSYVKDIVKLLKTIPEYEEASRNGNEPFVIIGKGSNRVGRILVDMTGGTEPSKELFSKLAQAGIGTIVAMHLQEGHFKKAKEEKINVIIAGHIASDNVGLNLLFDRVFGSEKINFIETSGFRRISRKGKK